jgi:hypothetical protein
MGIPTSHICTIILFDRDFKCNEGMNFEVMLGQTQKHFLYNYVILYNVAFFCLLS